MELEPIERVVSLGATCWSAIFYKDLLRERYPFDYGLVSHSALNHLLGGRFSSILDPGAGDEAIFKVGFYGQGNGYFFGHQKWEDYTELLLKIQRRCQRFLSLAKDGGRVLFLRERLRNSMVESGAFVENLRQTELVGTFAREYAEISRNLSNLGFHDFRLVYLIHSPVACLDGLVEVGGGFEVNPVWENFYSIAEGHLFDREPWEKVRAKLEKRFVLP